MNWEGDAIRRFDNVKLISIECKSDTIANETAPMFSEYIINYVVNGLQRFSYLRLSYVDSYTIVRKESQEPLCLGELSIVDEFMRILSRADALMERGPNDEATDEVINKIQRKHEIEFCKKLPETIGKAVIAGTPVNLVIETMHKGATYEFIRKIEFV